MNSVWQTLNKPILILAPMEDVTDTVFRQIIHSCGPPDLFFTEFTNVEGMASAGDKVVSQRLQYSPIEKPLIAQIWGKDPTHYYNAAKRIAEMEFDGIDINMGCPEKSVIKNGCCAALINDKPLAHEIIAATQEGAGELPVSVKTRIGFTTIVTEEWISFILEHNLAALIVHGRTAKEQSEVPARWDEIGKCVTLRNTMKKDTVIIGNGDVQSRAEALEKVADYGVDGVMIGRGIFHNPYLFGDHKQWEIMTPQQKLALLQRHVALFNTTWGKNKHYPTLKKYFKIYIAEFPGASELRAKFMETQTPLEAQELIAQQLNS